MDDSSSDYSDTIVLFQNSKESASASRAFHAFSHDSFAANAPKLNAQQRSMYLMEQYDQLPAELIPLLRDICKELLRHIHNSQPGLLQALTSLCDSKDDANGDSIFKKESIRQEREPAKPLHRAKHDEKVRKGTNPLSLQRPTLSLLAQKLQDVLNKAGSVNDKLNISVSKWGLQESQNMLKGCKTVVYDLGKGHELLRDENVALQAFKLDSGTYIDAFSGDIDLELAITYVEKMEACLKDAQEWFELISMRVSELPAVRGEEKAEAKKKSEEELKNQDNSGKESVKVCHKQGAPEKETEDLQCNQEASDDEITPVMHPTNNARKTEKAREGAKVTNQTGPYLDGRCDISRENNAAQEERIGLAEVAEAGDVKPSASDSTGAENELGYDEPSVSSPRSILRKITSLGLPGMPLGRKEIWTRKKKHAGKQLTDLHLFADRSHERLEEKGNIRTTSAKSKPSTVKEGIQRAVDRKNTERSLNETKERFCEVLKEDIKVMTEAIQIKQAELDRLMGIRN
ncbi:hypothetical protein BWQ96_01846 [Gracilariopsis chorda]|uniref:Uncharacterized protein n=1 Tax=Gracilariopsis chorda TaxID=448386 RepID=A0A2V3J1T2_9FLOR|nr:hypothetical protein BWQ96_01846 [Gracilariopsis chorda]|eukprot:PXF48386.1 hypothetical protein BWQ96_01846 [Gracilariopsis chorda]